MADGLHFAGHLTIDAVFRSLSATTSLNSSSAFVAFAGGSAGAVGVFNNCDYVASIVKGMVTCVPIGGYVPEIVWYPGAHGHTPAEDLRDDAFESHVQLFGARLPPACVASLGPTTSYKCISLGGTLHRILPFRSFKSFVVHLCVVPQDASLI